LLDCVDCFQYLDIPVHIPETIHAGFFGSGTRLGISILCSSHLCLCLLPDWASPTLARLHCTCACVCLLAWTDHLP